MSNISKFSHLQSLLRGEAKTVIAGLALTSANYKAAYDMLEERYGRKDRIINAHVQALLYPSQASNISSLKGRKYVSALWKFRDELLSHIHSLEALGIKGTQVEVFLCPIILGKLPDPIRLEWFRNSYLRDKEGDLSVLLKFLQQEIEQLESTETYKVQSTRSDPVSSSKNSSTSSASALHSSSTSSSVCCVFCKRNHFSENCISFLKLTPEERFQRFRSLGLCIRCMKPGHMGKDCNALCKLCRRYHHQVLCRGKDFTRKASTNQSTPVQSSPDPNSSDSSKAVSPAKPAMMSVASSKHYVSVLPTAKVKIVGKDGKTQLATILFDTGSDRSYVSSDLVKKISPKSINQEYIAYSSFGGTQSSSTMLTQIYALKLLDIENKCWLITYTF